MVISVLAAAGGVVLVDQMTKALALRCLPGVTANAGSWTGCAPSAPVLLGLWGVTLVCTALLLGAGGIAGAALAVALGGATSNLADRLGRGAVVDFIDLRWWPAFNLADVAIVVGVTVAVGSLV